MDGKPPGVGSNVIEVPLWWRKLQPVELDAVARARRSRTVPVAMHPGLGDETLALLEREREIIDSGGLKAAERMPRLLALEFLNAKLNRVVEQALPGDDRYVPHPIQWHDSGDGLTFWTQEADLAIGDRVELRFSLFAEQPMPMHAYCRVHRLRRDWNGSAIRVECRFETMDSAKQSPLSRPKVTPSSVEPTPSASPREPVMERSEFVMPARPETSAYYITPQVQGALPREIIPPAPDLTKPALPPAQPAEERHARMARKLAEGKEIVEAEPHHASAYLSDHPANRAGLMPKRQDYRLNDQLPLAWKIMSLKSFDQAVACFAERQHFLLREAVVAQKRMLFEADTLLKAMRQQNARARRPALWVREYLDHRFRQATGEEEENRFQACLGLFLTLLKALIKRPPGAADAAQLMAFFKDELDLRILKIQLDPVAQKLALLNTERDLSEVARQIDKRVEGLRTTDPELVDPLVGIRATLAGIDLSTLDIPKQLTPEGDAILGVNLSATGVGWRTLRQRIYKGDLVEIRLAVDPEGQGFETLWAYGRIVVVQDPDEFGRRRVACSFEHMSPLHRERLQIHITRRQREELGRRSGGS
ncbi:MAG: hypothetical protein HQM01_04050 [Magnetococcales bacterium]|nr:hypothetical protein [Magnetococcales bacterium]